MKQLLTLAILLILTTTSVYAHVTGAFGQFLVDPTDENTIQKLKTEIKETKKEIEKLKPIYQEKKEKYKKSETKMVSTLLFYKTMGVDTYANFLSTSQDIIDLISRQKIIEKKINKDIESLNHLYIDYKQLEMTKSSLEGHQELLNIIKGNLDKRQVMIDEHYKPHLDQERNIDILVDGLDFYWNNFTAPLSKNIKKDTKAIHDHLEKLVEKRSLTSPETITQKKLNTYTENTYFFRSDHVYIHYKDKYVDVILLGTMKKENNKAVLDLEAGFINGFMVPSQIIKKMMELEQTIYFDYRMIDPGAKDFYVQQSDGAIIFQSEKNTQE